MTTKEIDAIDWSQVKGIEVKYAHNNHRRGPGKIFKALKQEFCISEGGSRIELWHHYTLCGEEKMFLVDRWNSKNVIQWW